MASVPSLHGNGNFRDLSSQKSQGRLAIKKGAQNIVGDSPVSQSISEPVKLQLLTINKVSQIDECSINEVAERLEEEKAPN